jgi:hypothetical protein
VLTFEAWAQELKARGLATSGSKGDLVERLQAANAAPPPEEAPQEEEYLDPDTVFSLTVQPTIPSNS